MKKILLFLLVAAPLCVFSQIINITNLAPLNTSTGTIFSYDLAAANSSGSTSFAFKITSGPIGMSVVESTGLISFHPLSHQVGNFPITIEVKDEKKNLATFNTIINVTAGTTADPPAIYVVPITTVPNAPLTGNGTPANPYNRIPGALLAAADAGGGPVYVRGGNYNLIDIQRISAAATAANPIVIQPAPGEMVKFDFGTQQNAFEFDENTRHIEFTGFEIDGGTDNVDFWCLPAQAFWGDKSVFRGGGIAVLVDGENLTIRGNYIHNCYQKGVEIKRARYLKVYDNIIHSIATTSLSGGHGIMRQQSSGAILTNDNGTDFRWDIMGNLVFNVEQRIYSWVPSKGFIDMVLDEGKPILIDDPSDAADVSLSMKARIMNNVVAYGSIDQIRLKSTNKLTVSNNTVYSAAPLADGITDKKGDTNRPKFFSTILTNNAVQTKSITASYELGDIIDQGGTGANAPTISNNYAAFGRVLPNTGYAGVTRIMTNLFVDPDNGNFNLAPGIPTSIGVPTSVLAEIEVRKAKFGVTAKWDKWENDHLKLSQTILDNAPGVNDGSATVNETVVKNFGVLHLNALPVRSEIVFEVMDGLWKMENGNPVTEKFELHPDYAAWYKARNAATKNATGGDYPRIRWGDSILKQNQVFLNDWLTISQITPDTNTVILGEDENFTLDGDLLVDFEGVTPVIGNKWFLMKAKTITSANPPAKIGVKSAKKNAQTIFDRVLFEGATLTENDYQLTIENIPGGQALQLLIVNPLPVTLISFNGNVDEKSVNLNWKTANEKGFSHFELQKSTDAKEFNNILEVKATNSSLYNAVDNNPNIGTNYYRLKMVNLDGTSKYSNIISIDYDEDASYVTFENPANNNEILITTNLKNPIIKIATSVGTNINFEKLTTQKGYKLKLPNISGGLYNISIISDGKVITKKIILP
jgi:hypothetical protein